MKGWWKYSAKKHLDGAFDLVLGHSGSSSEEVKPG